jgi:dTDP-4-dehydrorhamnose 3,5-epimerase
MIFLETKLKGAFVIEPEPLRDERGFFARTWCKREFEAHGLNSDLVQCNLSVNTKRGTLRGMHHQKAPHEEAKLVQCIAGAIYDVIIDLRPDSPTFKQWLSLELSSGNRKMLFIPKGFSHGFLTLADHTDVFYQMSDFYDSESATGIRWNDPAFQISWPEAIKTISAKDLQYSDFKE